MKQEGLIKRVVKPLFLNNNSADVTVVWSPATTYLLIDGSSELKRGLSNYASVVGMLNYLQDYSCIDITFAVSQVARYVHTPKWSHKLALERVGHYL